MNKSILRRRHNDVDLDKLGHIVNILATIGAIVTFTLTWIFITK